MKKLSTLTLTGQGTNALLEKGKLVLGKGRLMQGIRCVFTFNIANASGTSRALTDAERQTFLDGYAVKLSYGKDLKRTPYNMLTLTRMQKLARFLYGSEWEGYTSTTTGMARTLTTGATTKVELYVTLPTGRLWQLGAMRRLFGVGRTQAAGMQLEVHRRQDALPSGFTVSGNVTVDIIPDDYSRKGPEQFCYLPEWHEVDETDRVARLPRGLVLLVTERSTTLAASLLTDIAAFVDGEELYSNMSAAAAYTQFLDLPNQPAEGDISDREAVLYSINSDMELRDYLTGSFRLEQITKTLGTTRLGGLVIPVPGEEEVRDDTRAAAGKLGRNKTLKTVNAAPFHGLELPHSLYPYMPLIILDTDDKEFQRYPGLVSQGGGPAEVFIPASVLGSARGMRAHSLANGEPALAEDVVRQVGLAVPGCVQDVHGLSKVGSTILTATRAAVGD